MISVFGDNMLVSKHYTITKDPFPYNKHRGIDKYPGQAKEKQKRWRP